MTISKIILAFNILFYTTSILSATDVFWTGSNGKWAEGSNWSTGMEPQPGDDVFVIEADTIQINGITNSVNYLFISQNARLNIKMGSTLQVTNTTSNYNRSIYVEGSIINNGTIVLDSIASRTGLYIDGGVLTNLGTISIFGKSGMIGPCFRIDGTLNNFGKISTISSAGHPNIRLDFGSIFNFDLIEIINGEEGLICNDFCRNESGGTINISSCSKGIVNMGTIINDNVMNVDSCNLEGINNQGSFSNSGAIFLSSNINCSYKQPFNNTSMFNSGLIQIEKPITNGIVITYGDFINSTLGEIRIIGNPSGNFLDLRYPMFVNDGLLEIDFTTKTN